MSPAPNRLNELRTAPERDWSLSDLEERSGVPRNSISLIERGDAELTLDKMRRFGRAFGVAPSALLNDEDVEFRPTPENAGLMETLRKIPPRLQAQTVHAALTIADLAQHMAAQRAHGVLAGDGQHVEKLAQMWNNMDADGRERALGVLEATGFADSHRPFRGKPGR
jgi:transcriptional regulator with XRE-family HTH domain